MPRPESRRRIHAGDRMILYAVRGTKRVFAEVEVTSDVCRSGDKDWPYRVDISYIVHLRRDRGVHIDEISTARRDLVRSIRQHSYIALYPEEYERAATKLRAASDSYDFDRQGG